MFDCRTDSNQKTGFSIRVDYVDSDCPIKNYCLFFCTCLVLFWNDFFLQIIMFHHCILVFLGQSLRRTHMTQNNLAIYHISAQHSQQNKRITHRKGWYVTKNCCSKFKTISYTWFFLPGNKTVFNTSLCITWHLWSTPGRGCQRFLKHLTRPYLRFLH